MYLSVKAEATRYTDEFGVEKKNKWQMPHFFRKRGSEQEVGVRW